jgi:hypothetical protein
VPLFKRAGTADILPAPPKVRAVVAAATQIKLDGSSWRDFKLGDERWQAEAWRHFDICGELRYVANWVGNAVSRCRIYVAEVDEKGVAGEEVTDPEIQALSESMFGGPGGKAEALRSLGINLTVPGEAYICAESVNNADQDIWYVLSTTEVSRQNEKVKVKRSNVYGGGTKELEEGKDMLIRVWTPHPRRYDAADSPVRAALPILREVEQLTKYSFAQMDSRLAGAGMLFVPEEIDFPKGEDDPDGAAGLMAVIGRAMAASLQNREDASSLVPIMATVPGEYVDKIKHVTFETPLVNASYEMKEKAIVRLATSLDVPPEVLLGQGDSNHWSAWQIEESAIKIHIVPVLSRICEALTTAYLKAALGLMGKDPEQYVFWYDTTPLTKRPDMEEPSQALYGERLISAETRREAAGFTEDDAPTDEERIQTLITDLVKMNPNLLTDPKVKEILGLPADMFADAGNVGGPGTGGAPVGGETINDGAAVEGQADQGDRSLPAAPEGTETPAQSGQTVQAALMVGSDMAVRRAMELAGKRLLTRQARVQGTAEGVPSHLLHTRLKVLDREHAAKLLEGAFAYVADMADEVGLPAPILEDALHTYCVELLTRAFPHEKELLRTFLAKGLSRV